MNSKIFSLNKAARPLLLICSLLLAAPISAQTYGNNDSSNYVTVYEHCDFRGAARNLPVGDYPNMRSVQLKNDSMSSFRIPPGMHLTVFQDDRYGGFSAEFDRDVACLDKGWNDQASSLKVNWSDSRGDRRDTRDRSYRGGNDDLYTQQNVDGNNVSRIEFAGLVLEKSGQRRWQLSNPNGSNSAFREVEKNANAVYLEGANNRQQLRVDLFSNDVTIINNNGQRASYELNRALRANENYRGNPRDFEEPRRDRVVRPQPVDPVRNSGQVRGKCFDYRASSSGGGAGIRFHTGDKKFTRFSEKATRGRICHSGRLVMEIAKTSPSTIVTVEIQGVQYRFDRNEAHDSHLNDWYRKNVTLNVRR